MKTNSFAIRHIGPSESDLNHMFKTIGVENFDQLIFETIPSNIRLKNELNLDKPMTEYEYLSHIQELGKKNKVFKSYIGLGYHPAIVPAVIQISHRIVVMVQGSTIAEGTPEEVMKNQAVIDAYLGELDYDVS